MADEMNTDERAKFEAWIEKVGGPHIKQPLMEGNPLAKQLMQAWWTAWQARAGIGFDAADMASASAQGFRDGVASLSAAEPAPEIFMMPETWHVTANVLGECILSIGYDWVSGKGELTEAETQAVIGMAQHLLSFVGYGLPPSSFDPDEAEPAPALTQGAAITSEPGNQASTEGVAITPETGNPLSAKGAAIAAGAPSIEDLCARIKAAELSEPEIARIYERYGGDMINCTRAIERAVRASHGQAPAQTADSQLLQFYGVTTDAELIAAQAAHIEKLQAKLTKTPSFAPQRVREG